VEFFNRSLYNYHGLQTILNRSYKCGYCGNKVSSEKGYRIGKQRDGSGEQVGGIYICPNCLGPTYFTTNNEQIPGESIGNSVSNVPEELNSLYEEARKCMINNCYTATVLICRKMLMNIAVNQGAGEGLKFIEYVNYLAEQGYIPPNGRHWVDHIRKKGNEANHEITSMNQEDGKDLLIFIEMLLKFIYEFPNLVPKK